MKTIETKGGMIFEIWETRKELLNDIDMMDWSGDMDFWGNDDALYIQYKDGSSFSVDTTFGIKGKFKRNNIEAAIYSNSATTMAFGNYKIYNIDNIEEEYSESIDDENKFWNADIA